MNDLTQQRDPLETAVVGFRHMAVSPAPEHESLVAELDALTVAAPSRRRRFLVKTLTTIAATTVMLTTLLLLTNSSPSLALADVVAESRKHRLVRYNLTQNMTMKRDEIVAPRVDVTYVDLKLPRLRMEYGPRLVLDDTLLTETVKIEDRKKDRLLHLYRRKVVVTEQTAISPLQAKYAKETLEDHMGGAMERKVAVLRHAIGETDTKPYGDFNNNRSFLENLEDLQKRDGVTVGREDSLDGRVTMAVFRLEEEKRKTALWVDLRTKLPVRIEYEIIDHTFEIARNHWLYTDFEWDPDDVADVDQLFSTTPPEGYVVDDRTQAEEGQ